MANEAMLFTVGCERMTRYLRPIDSAQKKDSMQLQQRMSHSIVVFQPAKQA